jgi:ribA/ribD-fused uncharacterized protein
MAVILSERETQTHLYFLRGVFSNFQTCNIRYKNLLFKTTEHAFMWEKANHFGDTQAAQEILNAKTPADAKAIGRRVKNFDRAEWDKVCDKYMLAVNIAKYEQNPQLAKYLLSTGVKTLVETNGKDNIWGIGLYASDDRVLNESKWLGQNRLGKVLMRVRQILPQ